ncbi:related to WSS1 Protein involved in sister chromatid separation and segregation [Cephalotrichum gorgonifer]|uniref:Related to WSS1 Protein involved in sister chromatid separation and segregation n=1 Tax=Cephalotrichum gorgonifer TaxID=2041049 RepID=A0AAE8T0A1_9PEZI|nr:related to WSS1 Protein involved in sister chromatid separation and segregation [Cephalotrichum gorgonifer]
MEREPLVLSYSHLKGLPRSDEALLRLKKIASMTKPVMRNRGWKLPILAEFFPAQPNLLGLNVNRGSKICVRLRYPGDKTQFMPFEEVLDTFLHELSHIVHGPHDQKFHALWDQLRSELEDLIRKGYTGDVFLGRGHVLGGLQVPPHERQRRWGEGQGGTARDGQNRVSKPGRRVGGAAANPRDDMRAIIARAAESRLVQTAGRPLGNSPSTLRLLGSSPDLPIVIPHGCGNESHCDLEVTEIAGEAISQGFRTKAEEDEANDAAIARALAEWPDAGPAGTASPGLGEWSCSRCTLLNPLTVRACQACEFTLAS